MRRENGTYGGGTAAAAAAFCGSASMNATALGALLNASAADGYVDDGKPASARGKLYKVKVTVHADRDVEDHHATLEDKDGKVLLTFVARARGKPKRNQVRAAAPAATSVPPPAAPLLVL